MMNRAKKVIALMMYLILAAVVTVVSLEVVYAAGNIDSSNKYAWGANVGWINFNPTNGGVTVYSDHLEGYAWGENVGWIRLGSYSGGGSHTYGNISNSNYGVNITATNVLTGYAWGANVGWINFNPTNGGVTIDWTTGSLDGYAWGENSGWIHFKNTSPTYNVAANFADLSLSKSVNPSSAAAGDTITYTLTFTNSGSYTATGVIITDIIPVSVTNSSVVSSGVTITQTAPGYVWAVQNLAPGDEGIITITADISSSLAAGTFTNMAVITTTSIDSDTNNNTFSAGVTVPIPVLTIGKAAQAVPNTSAAEYHSLITYTVTLTNSGGLDAASTLFTDTLPATKVDFARFISPPTPGDAAENSDIITWSGTVTANSVITFSYVVTHVGGYGESFSNKAQFLHPTTNQSGTITVPVTIEALSADLGLSKTISNNNPREGETITYTVVLSNAGPYTADNVVVSDTLPFALNLVQASVTKGSYNSPAWSVASLTKNEVQTLTLTATVKSGTAGQTITNTAEISASDATDPVTATNTATASLTVQEADLDLAKFITGPGDGSQLLKLTSANTGQQITYTLIITNNGPDVVPAGSVVSDTLPSSLTIIATGAVSGTIGNVGNLVTWNLLQLTVNEVTTATITATVNVGSASQTITNTASINSATQGDTVTANNSSAATLTVNGADLQIGKSVTPVSPLEGDTITYTIVVTNIAGDTSTNIVISDVLPTGLTYGALVSGSPSQGSYSAGSIGVWSEITLTLNSTASLVFTATVDGGTGGSTLVNSTGISSTTTEDPDSANNTASASVTVATFDLAISKSSTRDGSAITYTVTVVNNGPTAAPGAVISDVVPSGMLGGTWNWSCVASNGATCPNATGNGNINEISGSIPVNGQLTYNITATLVISTATMTNTATVTSLNGLGDSDASNNSATDISSVASGDIYLPIICKAGCLNLTVTGSDLIIVPGSLVATSSSITLQIQNAGNTATSGDFWVDVYFNPTQTPSLNKTWQSIASSGAAWGVTQSLAAGQVVTLVVGGTYYDASKSSSSFPSGANVYAYVDSVNYATTYGAVQESNESNNLSGPVTSMAGGAGPIVVGGIPIFGGNLPKR